MNRESCLTLCWLHSFDFFLPEEKVFSIMVQTRLACDFGSKRWKGGKHIMIEEAMLQDI